MRPICLFIVAAGGGLALFANGVQAQNESGRVERDEPRSAQAPDILSLPRNGKSRYGWTWLKKRFDQNADGVVTREEFPSETDFERLDRTWDGQLSADDFIWEAGGALLGRKETAFALFKAVDKSSEGRITVQEWQTAFDKSAGDKGFLTDEDLEELMFRPRVVKTQKERRGRAKSAMALVDDHGGLVTGVPEPGELAPDFELVTPDGTTVVKLSDSRGKRPVVLIFGCLSCGNYRTYSDSLERLYRKRRDQVEFLRVYVREAHPVDTAEPTGTNALAGILVKQPKTLAERCDVAQRFTTTMQIETPMVVDGIDNRVGRLYGGWPDRLYIIDREGRVAYQGGPGPFGFNPWEMEQELILLLQDQAAPVTRQVPRSSSAP